MLRGYVWARAAYPRYRYDQLMRLGVNRQFLVEGVYMDDRMGERGTLMVLTVAGVRRRKGAEKRSEHC